MQFRLPYVAPGQSVGLLGGSFDPAHGGHVHITLEALRRFDLDHLWWLVSPGNPLKAQGPAALPDRVARARDVMRHPRVTVTDAEAHMGTRYTADTLRILRERLPGRRLVWLMGADNLAQFHQWQEWTWIMNSFCVGVLARPARVIPALTSPASRRFRQARLPATASHLLARRAAPAWCFVHMPMVAQSSTAIRRAGQWK